MEALTRADLPEILRSLPVNNWRVWQSLEAILSLAKGRTICLRCGHVVEEHFSFYASSCRECEQIQRGIYSLPEHAVKGFWVGFQACRIFANYDPLIHTGLRLSGYAISDAEQIERNQQRAQMPSSIW